MPKTSELPSRDVLLVMLDYDPETGALTWKVGPNTGQPAFNCPGPYGSLRGTMKRRLFYAHRVIYKMAHGYSFDLQQINSSLS